MIGPITRDGEREGGGREGEEGGEGEREIDVNLK